MYLSLLKLNPRSKRVMTEGSRPYELHRSLLTAFPDEVDGGTGRVLFRLDIDRNTGNMSILVQSKKEPDWTKLNGHGDFVKEIKCKEINLLLSAGQILRFRLRANPSKRVKETGKRQGIFGELEQIEWLRKKGLQCGFELLEATAANEGFARDGKLNEHNERYQITVLSVIFEGLLRVIDPQAFRNTIETGIGSAKGFGFGLLSLARIEE